MRLHTLEIHAFGPFASPQVVDFNRLGSSGIFLLEGPTGAGKSTILDAITFAIYGKLSAGASEDRLHSDFAGPDDEPKVVLDFSVGKHRWRVTRSPEYKRAKKRGEGFTTQVARVHLERHEGETWVSKSSNKEEAGELITGAIGLTREQFIQVVLLPQGHFAKFLHSDDDARRQLLTKLFGTHLFDRIADGIEAQRTEATRQREAAKLKIQDALSAAAEAAGFDEIERSELLSLDPASLAPRLASLESELGSTAADLRQEADASQETLRAAEQTHATAAKRDELMGRLVGAFAKLAAHEATRPAHEQRGAQALAAQQAEPVRPLLEALDDAAKSAQERRDDLVKLVPEASDDMLRGQGACEREESAGLMERSATELQHWVELESDLPAKANALAELKKKAADDQRVVDRLAEQKKALPEDIEKRSQQVDRAKVLAAQLEATREALGIAADRRRAAERLAELEPQVAEKQIAVAQAVAAHQAAVDEHLRLVEARLSGIAAELASKLRDGTPCPVCGSLEHPAPAAPEGTAVTEKELAKAQERRRDTEQRVRDHEEHHRAAREQAAVHAATAAGRSLERTASEEAELTAAVREQEAAAGGLHAIEDQLREKRAAWERIDAEEREAIVRAAEVRERALAADRALVELREELRAKAAGHASVKAHQHALRAQADRERATADAVKALALTQAELDRARARSERELSERGFESVEAARTALLDRDALSALAKQIREWDNALAALRAAVEAEELIGLDPATVEAVQAEAVAAKHQWVLAQEAASSHTRAADAAVQRLTRFSERGKEVRDAVSDQASVIEKTKAVVRLAPIVKGTDAQRKMNLTTYVLRRWFEQVVQAANARLSTMSSGRYRLRRVDEAEHKGKRAGLTLLVTDNHTGEDRSTHSLSGGETFYVSLALALGLADVVKAEAGGVELDTLFIDEGFGSLDGDTLEQVMTVIDELRDCGRVVGIVSHVSELKERIPERLEVRKLENRSSTTRVVA